MIKHNMDSFFDTDNQTSSLHVYKLNADDFDSKLFHIQSSLGYIWLTSIIVTDRISSDGVFELKYDFLNTEEYCKFSILLHIPMDKVVTSISNMWMNASVFEQEIYENFGIKFNRKYRKKFYKQDENIFPLRKSTSVFPNIFSENINYDLNLCLNKSYSNNLINFGVFISNDLVENCDVVNGYYHIGIEKYFEGLSLSELIPSIESSFHVNGVQWSHLICLNVESANELTLTERAKALRMIVLELNRVYSHLLSILKLANNLEYNYLFDSVFLLIKRLKIINVSYSDNTKLYNLMTPGGISKDASQVWLSRVIDEIDIIKKEFIIIFRNFKSNSLLIKNLKIGLNSKNFGTSWSVSGPLARAMGINFDLRKLDPIYFYSDVDFEIPIGTSSSCYDLFTVKFEEIYQSINILTQVLDNLPTGEILLENNFGVLNKHNRDLEEKRIIDSVKSFNKFGNINKTSYFEGSDGLMGLSLVKGHNRFNRVGMISPSCANKVIFETLSIGKDASDLELFWTALNISMHEVER